MYINQQFFLFSYVKYPLKGFCFNLLHKEIIIKTIKKQKKKTHKNISTDCIANNGTICNKRLTLLSSESHCFQDRWHWLMVPNAGYSSYVTVLLVIISPQMWCMTSSSSVNRWGRGGDRDYFLWLPAARICNIKAERKDSISAASGLVAGTFQAQRS